MRTRDLILLALVVSGCILAAGCTQPAQSPGSTSTPTPAPLVTARQAPAGNITTADLVAFVSRAVAYARENGKEKAIAVFNDPDGQFCTNGLYIFAEAYDGTALAEPYEHGIVGTNIRSLTDHYDVPIVKNLGETARYGMGYVSYAYRNPANNGTVEPKLSVVADVDGTYYVGAGMYSSAGAVYPSVVLPPQEKPLTRDDLVAYVKDAVAYAQKNGNAKAIATFNNPNGQFSQGKPAIMAFDFNGTALASPSYAREVAEHHINLINYHDPDGVATIREMRDIARDGGGVSYTGAKVSAGGRDIYVPKIDYAEPVDGTWWLFSGIYAPDYARLGSGNLSGTQIRNHTRAELYTLVNRTVTYALANGRERTLAEINNPAGQFTNGDLFVWAESFDGTILADPYWKSGIGQNFMNYTDPYGQKTTAVAIDTIRNGTGFSHAMFPDTAVNSTRSIPKLVYMKAVDDQWWIGSGIYGVEVT